MKSKALLILILAVLAVPAYMGCGPKGADPYETFVLVMDRLNGPGQWSDQGHEWSRGGLTVKGLAMNMTPEAQAALKLAGPVTIDSVLIKKPASKGQVEKLLSLTDWQNQPGISLAEAIYLTGYKARMAAAAGGEADSEIKIEEMSLAGVKLDKAPSEAPAGAEGFLKALRLDSLNYKNFLLAFKGPEAEALAALESVALEGLSFDGDIPPELAALEGDAFFKRLALLNLKSFKTQGMKLDYTGLAPKYPPKASQTLASLEGKDLKSLKAAGLLTLAGLKSNFTDDQGQVHDFSLDSARLRGLDAADYLGKLLAGLAQAGDSREGAEAVISGQLTLADFFVSPISLEEATLNGLDFDLAGLISVKLAEAKSTGPYRAGEVPASVKSWVKGLEISLTGDPGAKAGTPGRDIHEFIEAAGRNTFALEAENEITYEPRTGLVNHRLNRLASRDLFDLSYTLTLDGLTSDRLEKFRQIPLGVIYLAALNPSDFLGDASFNALNIKYTDHGLVDLIFKLKAQEEAGVTGEDMKQRTINETDMMVTIMGGRHLKNTKDLSRPLLDFLKKPQSLEINISAAPPLSFPVVQNLHAEPIAILDALNITFSANGETGAPLRFISSPDGGRSPELEDEDFDLD